MDTIIAKEPALKYYPRMTPTAYLEWERMQPEKHEYFDGEIIAMSGALLKHNYIYSNLFVPIGAHLQGKPCGVFGSDLRVEIKAGNAYCYPDITIVCNEPKMADEAQDMIVNPTVIIEILSPSTAYYDTMRKKFFYMQLTSLQEYIMIDSSSVMTDSIRRTKEHTWENEVLTGIGNTLTIRSIQLQLPFSDIYRGVKA